MQITAQDIYYDIMVLAPLSIWGMFVINYLARQVYNLAVEKGYTLGSATYFGRKTIHILAVGLPTLLMPYLLREPLTAFFSGLGFTVYTYYFRRKNKLQNWYQVKENSYEVNFCIMWSLSFLLGWFLDKSFWLGAIPGLFISFGDGITGIVRNFKYGYQNKAWEGSLAMLIVCVIIGGWKFGWAGIIAAIIATLFERTEGFDDNVSIVLSSFAILALFHFLFPYLTTPLF